MSKRGGDLSNGDDDDGDGDGDGHDDVDDDGNPFNCARRATIGVPTNSTAA